MTGAVRGRSIVDVRKAPAALINLCAFPAVPQGKRCAMVNRTRSVITGWLVARQDFSALACASNNLVMSAFGPKQTSASAPQMSAFGGKADIRASMPRGDGLGRVPRKL